MIHDWFINNAVPVWLSVLFIFTIIAAYRPVWTILLAVEFAPLYVLRTEIFGFPTTLLEAGLLGTILGYSVRNVWAMLRGEKVIQKHWQQFRSVVPTNLLVFLALTALGWSLATIFSIDVRSSLGALKSWLIEPLLVGLIVLHEVRTELARRLLERGLLAVLTWVSLAGFVQLTVFSKTVEDGRLSSIFAPVANYYAMFAAPLLVYAIGMVLSRRDRTLALVASLISAVALVLSHSYGGILAVVVGTLVLIGRIIPAPNRRRIFLLLGVLFLVYGLAQLPSRHLREKINFSTRSSSLVRTQIWRTAIEIGRQHPIFGIGPNTFELAYREVAPTLYHPPLEWLVARPHNLYLNLWVETGLLGLVGTIGAGWIILRKMLRVGGSALLAAGFLAAIFAHGFVDTPLFKNDLALLAAIVIALGLTAAEPWKKN